MATTVSRRASEARRAFEARRAGDDDDLPSLFGDDDGADWGDACASLGAEGEGAAGCSSALLAGSSSGASSGSSAKAFSRIAMSMLKMM